MAEQFWLSDLQWAVIEPLLPHLGGKPRVDDRRVISGILHRYREGPSVARCPSRIRPAYHAVQPLRPLEREGHLAGTVGGACGLPGPAGVRHGRQLCRACAPFGSGCKRGQQNQAIGCSRGGRTTKIHALADGAGRLYALMLTAGQVHDIHGGRALLVSVPPMRKLIADKAYDANDPARLPRQPGYRTCHLAQSTPPYPTGVRQCRIPCPQPDRASLLPSQRLARRCDPLRQNGPQLPGRHLPRRPRHRLAPMESHALVEFGCRARHSAASPSLSRSG